MEQMMKCYCCGNKLTSPWGVFLEDDNNAEVLVGPDCFKKIKASTDAGYKHPTKGGPLLFFPKALAVAYRAKTYGSQS